MKLLVDMNLSPRWVGLLIDSGWQAVHWSTVGPVTAPDSEIMVIAALRQMRSELDAGALLTVDTIRTRLRLLPLLPSA